MTDDDDDRRLTRRLATLLALVPSATADRLAAQLDLPKAEIDRLVDPLLRTGLVTATPGRSGSHPRYSFAKEPRP